MTSAAVRLYGTTIGTVVWDDEREFGVFQYDEGFTNSGIQVAPVMMPLSAKPYTFPELSRETFKGLPGLLADALPDKFGNLLIDQWLAQQNRTPESFNSVERLCYLGSRAMGALEFEPTIFPVGTERILEVKALVELADRVLRDRGKLDTRLAPEHEEEALTDILRVGTSAGGARAKAVVAWDRETGEIRSGQVPLNPGFEPWLIKFDGVGGNADKELADPQGYGRIEYAYHLMALEAGLEMSECRLMEEHGRAHFMTRRFDYTSDGGKLHLQSLCALGHYDFNVAGGYSYEQAFQIARRLGLGHSSLEELYRRAVFNILARNQDDHTKNISFLMNRRGEWSLAPAYDVTYAYNPGGAWTARHQMSLNGKRDGFEKSDLIAAAKTVGVKPRRAKDMIAQVAAALEKWREFAAEAAVKETFSSQIEKTFRKY